ncbi:sensor histidine kinase [Streptomyces sp. SID8360]|nr:sensor histidine kinase [Streptomyces sp. SID4939]MYS04639.1 sensor histidine kinase [Streptomyces sp. SID4940]MYT68071.1 sensor histidine kinase [Streptomyces sp. SID8357]MYT86344.1 sensor histidine kinase [Streptomyces sp. SID8360]MYW41738.1 sensor histidine kinase [Streptomyces sp. SID1]
MVNTDVMPRLGVWQQAWRLMVAVAVGLPIWLSTLALMRARSGGAGSWILVGDPLVALGCLTLLLWRRRWPLAVAVAVTVASTVSALATGAALLALCSVATRRRPVEIGAVVLAYVTASQFAVEVYRVQGSAEALWWVEVAVPALTAGIAVATGMAVGARRVEVWSLRERAESAEREQSAREAQARALERNRIAREMHDVLAHRISLVAMQAGVLDHRGDLSADENRVLVRGIAEGSHQALEELREVLGVLRADPGRPDPPQPSLDRVPDLVADARASGLDVRLADAVTATPPDGVGRTCYRIVQEALTNAAKHAPGAVVRVTLGGAAGGTLDVGVRNGPAPRRTARPPDSGFGLLGLGERITLAGGELDHRPTPEGGYVLTARLPWPDDPAHIHEKSA